MVNFKEGCRLRYAQLPSKNKTKHPAQTAKLKSTNQPQTAHAKKGKIMKNRTKVPTHQQPAQPLDKNEDWQKEQRRIRAKAHANQARQALAEARNKRTNA